MTDDREAAGVVAVTSFGGSPGVTTTALALAAAWSTSRRLTLIEADPRGSSVAIRFGLHATSSVSTLLIEERHMLTLDGIARHAQLLPPAILGREVECLAGGRPYQRGPDVRRLWQGFCEAARGSRDFIVDLGRFEPDATTQPILERAEQVFVLVRPDLESIGFAKRAFQRFSEARGGLSRRGADPRRVSFLCIGSGPYTVRDLAKVLGGAIEEQTLLRPQFGELDHDKYAAAVLCGDDRYKVNVPTSRLVSSARALLPAPLRRNGAVG